MALSSFPADMCSSNLLLLEYLSHITFAIIATRYYQPEKTLTPLMNTPLSFDNLSTSPFCFLLLLY